MIKGNPYLETALPTVLHHHERWDGGGYPDNLAGEDIPVGARLLAVANELDNLTSDFPDRSSMSLEEAHNEIVSSAGSQFDPSIVEAFERCWRRGEIEKIYKSLNALSEDDASFAN